MSTEASAAIGFAVAGGVAFVATPLAILLARRLDFYDRPRGYHKHAAATPFLGGAAVLVSFLVAAAVVGAVSGNLLVVIGWAVALSALGTVDDAVAVAPKWRVLAAAGAAVALYVSGLGWDTAAVGGVDVLLTVCWVVGIVVAFNLMDNLDGACGTVATVSAAGVGVLAAIKGQPTITGMAFGVAGSCAAFLRWNLAGPAKIFLGDGGSMLVGFLVAALAMAVARRSEGGNAGLLVGALLVGLPMLDTALVSLSRTRRGVTLVTGGRDHLTHRLLLKLYSPRAVAIALAATQGLLCALAIVGYELGMVGLGVIAFAAFAGGVAAIAVLDTSPWRPAGIATAAPEGMESPSSAAASVGVDPG